MASRIINHLLMFGLCCACGMTMFDDVRAKHRALAVKINLCKAMVVGVILAWTCGVCVPIGGPNLDLAALAALWLRLQSTSICSLALNTPTNAVVWAMAVEVRLSTRLVSRRAPSNHCLHCHRIAGRSWPHMFHFREAAPHKTRRLCSNVCDGRFHVMCWLQGLQICP